MSRIGRLALLFAPVGALGLVACGRGGDAVDATPDEPSTMASAASEVTPLRTVAAGDRARQIFDVAEWRMFAARTATLIVGYGADGAPRRGIRVEPHAASGGLASYLEVSFLDGSRSHLYVFPSGAKRERRMTTDQVLLAVEVRHDLAADASLGLVKTTTAGAHVTPVRLRDGQACTDARLDGLKNAAGTAVQCTSDGLAAGEGAAAGCASMVWLFGVGCIAGGVIGGVAGFLMSDAVFDFLPSCTDAPGTISSAAGQIAAACASNDPPPSTDPLRACCVQQPGKECFWNDAANGCICELPCPAGQTCMGAENDDYSPTAYDVPSSTTACASCGPGVSDLVADGRTGAITPVRAVAAKPTAPVDGDRLCASKQGADLYCGYELGAAPANANRRYECVNGEFYGTDDCAQCYRTADDVVCSQKPAPDAGAGAPANGAPLREDLPPDDSAR